MASSLAWGNSGHAVLDFDLHDNPEVFHTSQAILTLKTVFPGIQEVSFDDLFLHFTLEQFPKKPWPITVAGVPYYLTTVGGDQINQGAMASIFSNPVRSNVQILQEIDARGKRVGSNTEIFDNHVKEAMKYFEDVNIDITQLMNWNDYVVIILKDKDQIKENLPKTIMHLPCFTLLQEKIIPDFA